MNAAGQMVQTWWAELGRKFPHVIPDAYVVMPNHFHGVIVIVGADLRVGPDSGFQGKGGHKETGAHTGAPLRGEEEMGAPSMGGIVGADLRVGPDSGFQGKGGHKETGAHTGAPLRGDAPIPQIVQWFKTMTTNAYIRGVKNDAWIPFAGKLWQRNYYEHIVRDEGDLNNIRGYIENNALKWAEDEENPRKVG